MLEIANDRYIVAKRIVGANIYTKDNVIRLAITLDTVNVEERTVFAGPFSSKEEAKGFVQRLSDHL